MTETQEFKMFEPLKANRWLIETYPTKISSHLFRKNRIYNDGDKIIFKVKFLQTVNDVHNPLDLLEITDITLKYLDPIGETVGGYKMIVGGLNFDTKLSYSNDGLLIIKMVFVIKHIQPLPEKTK